VFWGVLWLGAILFTLINLSFIETLIERLGIRQPRNGIARSSAEAIAIAAEIGFLRFGSYCNASMSDAYLL
jgi:hypothetical protein